MSDSLTIAAEMGGVRPRKDGSWSLTFSTNIPSPEDRTKIMDLFGKYGILSFFDKEELSEEDKAFLSDIDNADVDLGETKTLSQRLRAVLWILHTQNGGGKDTFKTYYTQQMERLITHFKSKIDDVL